MGAVLTHEDLSNDWLNLDSRGPARGGLHDPWTQWMVKKAEPDAWLQVHGMWGDKKLNGALKAVSSGGHCYLYLTQEIWGSPPPLEAQPVASSAGRPQPVKGPRSERKSILDVEQTLEGHPYVHFVTRHNSEAKGKNLQNHLSPWDLEFHTANRRYHLGLSCYGDGPGICHGWLRFPESAGKKRERRLHRHLLECVRLCLNQR